MCYYVYLLENRDDRSWYIGFTNNLKRRLLDHQNGRGGRTTKLKKRWRLIYFEGYLVKEDALGREKFLKSGSGYKYLRKQLKYYLPVSEIKDNLDRSVENVSSPV